MAQQTERKKLITEIMEADAKDGLYEQQTAVEYLSEIISMAGIKLPVELINKAKAMEKNQRQKDWDEGFESGAKSPEDVPLKISNTITLSNK